MLPLHAACSSPAYRHRSRSLLGKTVAVIGGGVGGLATAGLLARRGAEVHVFERRSVVGGLWHRFSLAALT